MASVDAAKRNSSQEDLCLCMLLDAQQAGKDIMSCAVAIAFADWSTSSFLIKMANRPHKH